MVIIFYFFFFFSSRRRHTRCSRDWSSDVCSSDLTLEDPHQFPSEREFLQLVLRMISGYSDELYDHSLRVADRSEERRVGKSVDLGGRRIIKKKKRKKRESRYCKETMTQTCNEYRC